MHLHKSLLWHQNQANFTKIKMALRNKVYVHRTKLEQCKFGIQYCH
jgi:hypothetical protein